MGSECKAFIREHNAEDPQYRRYNIMSCDSVNATNCTISYGGIPKEQMHNAIRELGTWLCIPKACRPQDPGPVQHFFEAGIKGHSGLDVDVQMKCSARDRSEY